MTELDDKTLDSWYHYSPYPTFTQGVIRSLIDALRATRQELDALRKRLEKELDHDKRP